MYIYLEHYSTNIYTCPVTRYSTYTCKPGTLYSTYMHT